MPSDGEEDDDDDNDDDDDDGMLAKKIKTFYRIQIFKLLFYVISPFSPFMPMRYFV